MAGTIALALVPIVVLLVATVAQSGRYRPVSDDALLELQVRDVGSRLLLLGPYSRFGWYHPGPALAYVLAPAYRLSGSTVVGLPISALAVNAAAIVASAVVAVRRGGALLLTLTLLGAVLLMGGLGGAAVRDAWNPTVTVLPFVCFVLLVWATSAERWALPVAVGIGSFLVQAHVGYAPVVGVLLVAAAVVTVVTARRLGSRLGPVLAVTGLVAVAFWALPLFEQLTRDPGNLGMALRFAGDHGSDHTVGQGWHAVAGALGWRMPWATGSVGLNVFSGEILLGGGAAVPLGLLALVAATVLAAFRRDGEAALLDATVLVALGVAVVAVSRIVGPGFPYLVLWVSAVAMLAWVAASWTVSRAVLAVAGRRAERIVLGVLGAALVVAVAVVAVDFASVAVPDPAIVRVLRSVTPAVVASVDRGEGPVVLDSLDQTATRGVVAGLALALERRGIAVRVTPDDALRFGPTRRVDGTRPRARIYVGSRALGPPGGSAAGWRRLATATVPPAPFSTEARDVTVFARVPGPVAGAE